MTSRVGPKARSIIEEARLHPDWTQEQIAAYCGSTRGSVRGILCIARQQGLVDFRAIDAVRYRRGAALKWLPDCRRAEYKRPCNSFKAAEARRMIEADIAKNGVCGAGFP